MGTTSVVGLGVGGDSVKFTVTALGAHAGGEADAARRITDYLMGRAPDPNRPMVGQFGSATTSSAASLVGYYRADQLEGDGWWGGLGAQRLGLDGPVDGRVLEQLLAGRNPFNGERLLSARGSSGRAALKRGEHTRLVGGVRVWGIDDAAARFDLNHGRAAELVGQLSESAFVADKHGQRWLTEGGLLALADLNAASEGDHYSAVARRLAGAAEELTTGQAAALTGTTERHIRKIIGEWATNRKLIEAGEEGRRLPWKRAWLPARRQGGQWRIDRGDLVAYWNRRRPPAVRQAYDVVATVEKSVSLLTLLSSDRTKRACVDAIVAANAEGMAYLDQHASRGRRKGSSISSEGFVWASFMHATSRSLDPHPHIHNVVMNFIEDPFGQGRAVDARFLFTEAKAASALATGQLRWELNRVFPQLRWVRHGRAGIWEILGIGRELIKEFSTRRAEIEAAAEQLVGPDGTLPTRFELQEIARTTRSPKVVVDAAVVLADWLARAEAVGFDEQQVISHAPAGETTWLSPQLSEAEKGDLFEFLATSPDGACDEESTFDYGDLLAAINRWCPNGEPRVLPGAAIASLANDFLATQLAIPVDHDAGLITRRDGRTVGRVLKQERWTTPDMVRTQVAIVNLWGAGIDRGYLLDVDHGTIDEICTDEGVGPEQADLIRSWSGSGDQFQAAIGQPGTGKTFTMRAARQIWERHGYRVLGAAVKGTAAQHLARETGIRCETVAHYLRAAAHGIQKLDGRTILVIDEATTLSDRDLRALMHLCRQAGAVLRMIGDPAQQQSVAAGGMWEHMIDCYRSRSPELTEQRRLRDPDEVRTAQLLRQGRIEEAFDALLATGKIKQAEDPTQGELIALAGWLDRLQRGIHAPMIDRRNAARERLNLIAQAIRVRAGQVAALHPYGEREFGVGDQVVATQPNRRLFPHGAPRSYLSNGSTGTVVATSPDGLRVRFDGLGEIDVPAATVRTHIELGYALTAFSVQGLTLDEAESTARPGEEIHSLYVMLTRGRNSNTLITTRPLGGESHGVDMQPQQLPVVEVAETITDTTLRPAIVVDTVLPHLLHRSSAPVRTSDERSIQRRLADNDQERAVRHALNHPPQLFLSRFPPKPAAPLLARRWEASLRAVAVYHHRWPHPSPPSVGNGAHMLGPEPLPGSAQHGEWTATTDLLERNALAIALRHLADTGHRDGGSWTFQPDPARTQDDPSRPTPPRSTHPVWQIEYLRTQARNGNLNSTTNFPLLAHWLHLVAIARSEAGIPDQEVLPTTAGDCAVTSARLDLLLTRDPLQQSPLRATLER